MARVPYIDAQDLPQGKQTLVESHAVRPGEPLHVRQVIANNSSLLEAHHDYGGRIRQETGLEMRDRELAILTIAYETRSKYIWQQHVTFSMGKIVSEEELRNLTETEDDGFESREAMLIEYVNAFIDQTVEDSLHERMSSYYTDSEIVGVGLLITYYIGLAQIIDALDVDIEHDQFVGWEPSTP